MDGEGLRIDEKSRVVMVSVDDVLPNEWNPNEMDTGMFNRLVEDMKNVHLGYLQPVLLVPHPEREGKFMIVDGEHRFEAARLSDYEKIPAVVVEDGELAKNVDLQKFQTIRMNRLRGRLNTRKLKEMVLDLSKRHTIDEIAESFAMDDSEALRSLTADARRSLPTEEMKREFDQAQKEIKTVDDLSLVLNRLFTRFGSTLPYHYMILDFGGKDHIWVRIPDRGAYDMVKERARLCQSVGVTVSSALMRLVEEGLTEEWLQAHVDVLEGVEQEADEDDGAF